LEQYANESEPSTGAAAKVYAPVLAQPRTPAGQPTIQVSGSNAAANATVEIFADTGSGPVSQEGAL